MKITILDSAEGEEDEIIVKCANLDENLLSLLNTFKTGKSKLSFYQGTKIVFAEESEIFYFEYVDNRVFAYTKNDCFEVRERLYELEERLVGTEFFRASKAVILNLNKISSLSPAFGGRFEAVLKNGLKVIISRMYVPKLKERLGL